MNQTTAGYPAFPAGPHADVLHGRTVPDPFRALESAGDEVDGWVARQNGSARNWLDSREPDADTVRLLTTLLELPTRTVPAQRPTGLFFTEKRQGADAPLLRREHSDGIEDLVDPIRRVGSPTARIAAWSVSPDGALLAFQLSGRGQRLGPLILRELATGAESELPPRGLERPALAWTATGILYARSRSGDGGSDACGLFHLDLASGRSTSVWQPESDIEPVFAVPAVSADRRSLLLTVRYGGDRRNALLLGDLADGLESVRWRTLLPAGRTVTHARFDAAGRLLVHTDLGAARGRVCSVDPDDTDPSRWRELYVPRGEAVIRHVVPFRGGVAVHSVDRGVSRVELVDPATADIRELALPGEGIVRSMTAGDGDEPVLWISYEQPAVPPRVLRVCADSPADHAVWFAAPLEAAVDVTVTAETCLSADGTRIPVTVFEPGSGASSQRPMILSVYGGFGLTLNREFNAQLLAWLSGGGAYAFAHVRGGGDLGAAWHDAGRGRGKSRSVDDLIAVAEHLSATGRTSRDRLALFGASNGGLLAAAAGVRRPDLVRACVAVHPVTDLARYTRLGDGAAWKSEYGDPEDAGDLAALLSYSPYHAVRDGVRYPAFLFMAGSSDRRVPSAHSRKLCAALQAATRADPDTFPVLLREEAEVGHGAVPADLVNRWHLDRFTFLADCLGLGRARPGTPERNGVFEP
ncbi:MAG TPA: prolyl oligopeptidase family serine peptidase [Actinospica sp.]|jgi:prolyl oligopeptidase|nr:prolyl oligopeptidase family serine peptidase [Actinospica sp.]